MPSTVFHAVGWIGDVIVATGYVLVSLQRVEPSRRTFHALNVSGGALLTVTALYRFELPNMILNILWMAFGGYALWSSFRHRGDDRAGVRVEASAPSKGESTGSRAQQSNDVDDVSDAKGINY